MQLTSIRNAKSLGHRWGLGLLICSCLVATGCRSNGQNPTAFRWPWQRPIGLAQAPTAPTVPNASVPNIPQLASNPNNGPWSTVGTNPNGTPVDRLRDLFRREDEQSRLADEQRKALADLAIWQKRQEEQIGMLSQERQQDRVAELQEQASIVAAQRQELEQLTELRRRSLELDTNNSELHAQLAQAEQQNRLLEDQMQLLQTQLNDAATQLQSSLTAQQETEQRILQAQSDSQQRFMQAQSESQQRIAEVQKDAQQRVSALQASMQRRGSATITANSSLQRSLTPVSIAGLLVRPDGDVIRIELPSDRVFAPSTAALQPNAASLIDQVAATIRQSYPEQVIGIEAHTDSAPIQNTAWRNPHQLTAAQSMAVLEQFINRHQFPSQQLFQLGHGANHPIASNATSAGQQRNRRVEVVIYPETVGQR